MKVSINQPPINYLPFLKGKYSIAPNLKLLEKATDHDRLVFQLDNEFEFFRKAKDECRKEDIHKYYCKKDYNSSLEREVNLYLANQLCKEHPTYFIKTSIGGRTMLQCLHSGEVIQFDQDGALVGDSSYLDLFDALCCQLQEDIAICQLGHEKDWLAAIHLCLPNHWSAEEKIGRNFDFVHEVVPGMEKIRRNYFRMLENVVNKGPYSRFGWGVSTDTRLNHHPEPPSGYPPDMWYGRKFDSENPMLFIRTERQVLVGFPQHNAFMFTIRSYFADVSKMDIPTLEAFKSSLLSMSEETLTYKGIDDKRDDVLEWIETLIQG